MREHENDEADDNHTPVADAAVQERDRHGSLAAEASHGDENPHHACLDEAERSAMIVPSALLAETRSLARAKYARYTSPIFAGTTQLTKNDVMTMPVSGLAGRSSPALRSSTCQRTPRTAKEA